MRRKDGRLERLKGCDQTVLEAGEAIIIKTPTGGGFGPAKSGKCSCSVARFGNQQVLISGGGIAGLTLAVLLKEQGYEPLVVERTRSSGAKAT